MKIYDEVKVITKESYNGQFYGVCGKIEKVWPNNLDCPYPYEVSFGDGSGTWPFSTDELELLS